MARRDKSRPGGPRATDLVEEAVHALRSAPVGALMAYYVGSAPFVLALLYFVADMSGDAFAYRRCAGEALGLSFLFVWMKAWHSVFARGVRDALSGAEPEPWTVRRWLGVALRQGGIQPSGPAVLLVACVPALPVAWLYAYYQNATVLDGSDGEEMAPPSDREGRPSLRSRAWRQAMLWPRQNHAILAILSLFALLVFVNVVAGLATAALLTKVFTGLETAFTRSPWAYLNTTFLATAAALTWLIVDPLVKAVYVLRVFYGESIATGEELRARLRAAVRSAAPLVLGAALLCASATAWAGEASAPGDPAPGPNGPGTPLLATTDLDRALDETLAQRKYTWRMPREEVSEKDEGFLSSVFAWIEGGVVWVGKRVIGLVRRVKDWLDRRLPSGPPGERSGIGRVNWVLLVLYLVIGALVVVLIYLIAKVWLHYRRAGEPLELEAVPGGAPDLEDEGVSADELPPDEWMVMASDMMNRGEWRLALRALYLSSLSRLSGRDLLTVQRYKSNLDYARELKRRAHPYPGLLSAFDENLLTLERTWYGDHTATSEMVAGFSRNMERMWGEIGG